MRLTVVVVAAVIALAPGDAAAYPQFQLSTGADRCEVCHVASSGGGLLNEYGRSEVTDTISSRGDGALAHGAFTLPPWVDLGLDLRGALGVRQLDEEEPTVLAFPMQADVHARVVGGPVSLNVTVGLNGAARERPDGPDVLDYVGSRQHYVMYERGETVSVRAGRFFPVFGVRSQDHTAYPRRYLGQDLLEEPYALEVGLADVAHEAHVAAFVANPIPQTGAGPGSSGASAYYERRVAAGTAAIAGQARFAIGPDDRRYTLGGIGKWWHEGTKLMVIGELDLQRQDIPDASFARWQLAAHLGVTRMMLPGYMVGAAIQRWAPDLTLTGTTRNAVELDLQAFPWAHFELHLLTRVEATGGDTTHPNLLALLQLHYFL